MTAFAKKLARLAEARPELEPPAGGRGRGPGAYGEAGGLRPPTLDELRDRIAAILAKTSSPSSRRSAPLGEEEEDPTIAAFRPVETPLGPVPTFLRDALAGERVGVAPIWAAKSADPSVLALLALDPSLADCDPLRAVYVDTETTGLAGGAGTLAFLVGLSWYEPSRRAFVVEQLLLTDLDREAPLIARVKERLEQASMFVTYNGKAFDLPLLRTRAVMTRNGALPVRPHLDLLHVVRRLHKHRLGHRAGGCSLGAVEAEVLGQERVGDVAGADIALVYQHYLRTRDTRALGPVVRHNTLDVLSMVALVGLYGEPLESWAQEVSSGETWNADGPQSEGRAPMVTRPRGAGITPGDLAAAAKVARRAGALELAEDLATTSVARGGGSRALRVRGDVRRARGDKARALADYEAALRLTFEDATSFEADDDASALRLTLAKLYEHHARAYEKALGVIASGTPEASSNHARREKRLLDKLQRAAAIKDREGPQVASPIVQPIVQSNARRGKLPRL